MGLFKGSVTLSRYRLSGEPPSLEPRWLDRRVRAHAFRDIEDSREEMAAGWVSPHDFMDTRFARTPHLVEPYLLLGLRVDRRQVGAALLRKYHRLEMDKARAASEDGRLSRRQRELLKEKARQDLLRRLPPASRVFDVVWDTSRGEVWLGSATAWVREVFEDLFARSFQVGLALLTPWDLARAAAGSDLRAALEEARPLSLEADEP